MQLDREATCHIPSDMKNRLKEAGKLDIPEELNGGTAAHFAAHYGRVKCLQTILTASPSAANMMYSKTFTGKSLADLVAEKNIEMVAKLRRVFDQRVLSVLMHSRLFFFLLGLPQQPVLAFVQQRLLHYWSALI